MNKITVEEVRKQFNTKVAVDGVSFDISSGTVFGLLGPNGAGKTTLLRMLIDMIKPDSGRILYNGRMLADSDKDRITYLPEERGLYRKQKVGEVLEYFATLKGLTRSLARTRVRLYLEKLEMADTADKKVEELSKGNQQIIQLASALLSEPDLILLDEPFSGLDPLNVRLTKLLLAEEKQKGKTILLSTHQMNQVEELCDDLMMINHGRQVLYGSLDEILRQYAEPALLLECSPLDGDFPEIERVVSEGKFLKVFPRPGVSPSHLLKLLIERGVQIERFQKAATPLEEIFIKVARAERAEPANG